MRGDGQEDERPQRERPSKGGIPAWVWALGAGVLLLLACCALAVVVVAISPRSPASSGKSADVEKSDVKVAGQIFPATILNEYYGTPGANRAVIADKYFGKYWRIDLSRDQLQVEEDHAHVTAFFFERHLARFYFRDRKDLLRFVPDPKTSKHAGPKVIVGKAVSANLFEDCFAP